ncbi:BRCA1-A complex subunit RAP80 isoform X2 [Centropristis striata]|uniref:BRCA1-A complex subunit RAP80 isoform X2 n=1 Tax=Centropristis striata TaxID=184440 RepID=UPI0027E178E9|nr:BRCA1-A complex subunit RAP80 isoform X2 [Centropristis striata]
MRGRRGHSSSPVSQEQSSMPLRKQIFKDASNVPSGSQQIDENTEEDEALDEQNNNDKLSSVRQTRKRERENKSKPKEMTEEEMMDLALRLSEQEASVTALRVQQEEEAMLKAIQESMVSQTQPCPPNQSQSLLTNAEASLRLCSRRKLIYSNGKALSAIDQGAPEDVCAPEKHLNRGAKGTGDECNHRNKKLKRKEGSPLREMPDLSQTQKIDSPASTCSSVCLSVPLDSPQSSDSTQIDDCQLRKSPVFPSTGCIAEVHIPRLSQDLLETCRTSGFVVCSQDSSLSIEKSLPTSAKSPTFPKSPKRSNKLTLSKSPVFSETDQGDDEQTEQSPEYLKSPVFGRNTQHKMSPSACKPQAGVCSSGFMSSSQESLSSSVRSTSCHPRSPIFPKISLPPLDRSATCKSPLFSETDEEQTLENNEFCKSPVFGRSGQQQKTVSEQKHSVSASAAELRGSDSEGSSTPTRNPFQSPRQDRKTDHNQDARFNKSDNAEEENEILENSAKEELTSDMKLLMSDEDEEVTPGGSPSPVFPGEKAVHHVDTEAASLNHVTAASPGQNCRQQLSTTVQEPQPSSSQGAASRASAPLGEPAAGSTVHYYWGVPFCPRGLDPDTYTQVIVAQMEVYEKSLKQAQRGLLRKAEWGEPIMPQPEKSPSPEPPAELSQQLIPRRRGLRLKGKRLCDADTEEEDEYKKDEDEEEGRESKEEEKEGKEEGQVDTDDCEVCPETQLSNYDDDRTQDLMLETDTGATLGFQSDYKKSPELPEVEMILQDDSQARDELKEEEEEEMEVDVEVDVELDVDTKIRGTPVRSSEIGGQHIRKEDMEEDGGDPDVEVIKVQRLQRSKSPELEPNANPQSPETRVDCPICQGSFPVTKIEVHAAYCDGEVAVLDERRPENSRLQVSLKQRRKRTRRAETAAEEALETSNAGKNEEKCYICQKAVPLSDYGLHTELCLQLKAQKTAGKGNLLSALEQTESRDSEAGPSGSKLQPGDVIELLDDDEEEEGGSNSVLRISNSPIRSFTPISEATDCLINFKKHQPAKKLRQRRR